jgi:hypothetical protein
VRRAVTDEADRAVKYARAFAAAAVLAGCNAGPLEVAGSDTSDASGSLANGVDPQIDPRLLPPGAPDHGIYLYWLFDTDSITVGVDASGHGRDGQFLGLPTLSDPAPTARSNDERGLFFNGTGQAVAYTADTSLAELTFGLWVKPACAGACRVFSIAGATGEPSVTLDIDAAGTVELGAGASSELAGSKPCTACAIGATPILSEHWYYVAATVDAAGEARLFINGEEDGAVAGVPLPSSTQRLTLGSDSSTAATGFRGVLDEAIVYDWVVPSTDLVHLATL